MTAKVVTLPIQQDGRRDYEAATRRRGDYHWITGNGSADAEILKSIATLRAKARDLVRNNAYASRAVQALVSNIIGDGIKPKSATGSVAADKRVMALWNEWADEIGFDGLQSLAVRSMIESGECLVRRYRRRPGSMPVPLMVRAHEADHLDATRHQPSGGGVVVGGIQYDPVGDVEGYWLFNRHPGDASGLRLESSFVRAESVRHLYRVDRPGQSRGVTWLAPVIGMLRQIGDYQDAAIMKAKVEACFVAAIERDGEGVNSPIGQPESEATKQTLDLSGNPVERIEPGMVLDLKPGEKLTTHSPGGQGDFEEFLLQLLYAASSGVGVTYDQMTSDLRQANFSSLRAGKIEQRRLVEQWQYHLVVPKLCRPVWRWFIEQATATGLLPERRGGYPVKWIAPRHEPIDPLKEGQAVRDMIEGGLKPRSWAAAELGWDYDDMLAAYAEDAAKEKALGLTFGQAAAAPAPPEDMEDEDGDD